MALQTFLRYLRIQLFVFVCGIVGPLFLVMYFTAWPRLELRWMYWAGLVITTVDVLIALLITSGLEIPTSKSKKPSD
jgi:hypothetical protein